MLVTALGHAGLRIETTAVSLLMDPWFSPEGAFLASWFPYPDNSHLLSPELLRPSAVAVSHEHLDHLDPWFLSRVDPGVPVVTCRYPSPVVRHKVTRACAREVIELAPWEPLRLAGDLELFFVPEESPMNHDAAMVVVAEGASVVNLNDARLSPAQLRAIRTVVGGTVDLLLLQGAGASWFPLCYRYPPERRQELSHQKRMAKFAYVARAVAAVEPVTIAPFAGPPCFLDPALAHHNDERSEGIFPDQQQVAGVLRSSGLENVVVLLPGDSFEPSQRTRLGDPHWSGFSFADRSYERSYALRRGDAITAVKARHPEPSSSLWEPFRSYFEPLLRLNGYFSERIAMRIGFDVVGPGGGHWAVDFRPGAQGVLDEPGDCSYNYCLESRWLPPLLSGDLLWEDFFLSLRFEAWREPDVYNDHLLGLLKFADAPALDAVEAFERAIGADETITLRAEGRTYRIQRRCPHAGQDLLETGEVLEGRFLRCLAHHYEFDLETGACRNGLCTPLATERIDADDAGPSATSGS